jgi:ribulose 1,5-bisphosphate synthetase/thiazole synthase
MTDLAPVETTNLDPGNDTPAMTEHSVVIAGGGPTGLAGEVALEGVDVAIVERRAGQGRD